MDTANKSLIVLDREVADITLLPVVRLKQEKDGKVIVKQLPAMPVVECFKEGCDELAIHLMQFVGNDLTFSHTFTCIKHTEEVLANQ